MGRHQTDRITTANLHWIDPQIMNPVITRTANFVQATSRVINLSWAPTLGITIHIVPAVIDPAAPGGIAFVTEPYPLQI